ncbi:MAG TPA: FAD-dependent oxidoreductase, partial [Bacteroidota bacterium]|nr:FAD-dependent oxidoreductase [Bacteroidota bacterium]
MTGARPNLGKGRINSIVVIGGGPGGYPAAIRAAQLGADVVLVEKGRIGGTCLHRGCIPTKFLLKAAREYMDHLRLHEEAGERIPGPDRVRIASRMGQVVEHLAMGTSSLLGKNGVRVVAGTASFVEPGVVRISESGELLRGSSIIVATGAGPSRLPLDGADLPGVVDSDGILALDMIPQTLAIIGGGVVGIEFAQ